MTHAALACKLDPIDSAGPLVGAAAVGAALPVVFGAPAVVVRLPWPVGCATSVEEQADSDAVPAPVLLPATFAKLAQDTLVLLA